jgi:hypothetical protein
MGLFGKKKSKKKATPQAQAAAAPPPAPAPVRVGQSVSEYERSLTGMTPSALSEERAGPARQTSGSAA